MITPLRNAKLQNDMDCGGHSLLNIGGIGARLFDVKTYGATGDGVTDDTGAIQAALAAIPATGGVFYFPAGKYKYAGSALNLNKSITVLGDGGGVRYLSTVPIVGVTGQPALSSIDFNSSTGVLFDVTAHGCAFSNLGLRNTSVGTPTAGSAIRISSGGDRTRYENVAIDGFYVGIDVQAGSGHVWDGCWICAPILYGLRLRNLLIIDAGDHFISNCYITEGNSRNAAAAIRIESGGGVKIVNTKINTISNSAFAAGIDLAVGNSVITVDMLVANCSIEGFSGYGIKCTSGTSAQWSSIVITGNQISPYVAGNPRGIYFNGTTATDFNGVLITGNHGLALPTSTSPFISLANCSNVSIAGNNHVGYGALITINAGVTFARSASVPPGGTTGQSLKKLSNADYDVGWV